MAKAKPTKTPSITANQSGRCGALIGDDQRFDSIGHKRAMGDRDHCGMPSSVSIDGKLVCSYHYDRVRARVENLPSLGEVRTASAPKANSDQRDEGKQDGTKTRNRPKK